MEEDYQLLGVPCNATNDMILEAYYETFFKIEKSLLQQDGVFQVEDISKVNRSVLEFCQFLFGIKSFYFYINEKIFI